MTRGPSVLFISSEVAPYSKTGGLADVAGALPAALAAVGVRVVVVTPRYGSIDPARFSLARRLRTLTVPVGARTVEVGIYEGRIPGSTVPIYLIDHEPSFGRAGIYNEAGKDYPDNAFRFALLSRGALEVARSLSSWPDIVHAHDWQAALAPYMVRRGLVPGAPPTGTMTTIHNLAFQGLFPKETVDELGLPWEDFTPEGFEFFENLSLLKAGIVASDSVTTVSPRYAKEIQTEEFGCGFDGLLRVQKSKLTGILNGVDYRVWDPSVDPLIAHTFSTDDPSGKAACKQDLQRSFGLPVRKEVPVLGSISRLTDQKGFDLIVKIAEEIARLDLQYVVLGSGDKALEDALVQLAKKHPTKFAVKIAYDDKVAHQIEAGSDLFLMPSRFEPCGLNQMYSLRYGTLPIVRAVGGLDDSVVDWDGRTRTGNGFKFEEYSAELLLKTVKRALTAFSDREAWAAVQKSAMRQDHSWGASARRYASLYEKIAPKK